MIDTQFLKRCNQTLEEAYKQLTLSDQKSIQYDLYRSAVIKEFEVILEQSGKLLKKILLPYLHSKKALDQLTFKAIFRHAGNYGLLEIGEVERWMVYRDNRNLTAHDYGFDLAEKTLPLIPSFVEDVNSLIKIIEKNNAIEN